MLASTEALVNSLLNPSKQIDEEAEGSHRVAPYPLAAGLQVTSGILRFSKDATVSLPTVDDSSLVGLSASLLKRLSITSGSLVMDLRHFCVLRLLGDVYLDRL